MSLSGAKPGRDAPAAIGAERTCPICGRPQTPAYRPFCSRRCADVDLHRWLSGAYAIPVEDVDRPDAPGETPEGGA